MSLIDDLISSVPKPADLPNLKQLLDRTVAAVQARVGTFLQQKQRLLGLETRSSALSRVGVGTANASSTILLSRTRSLLSTQDAIESSAMKELQAANAFKTQLETDPFWRGLASSSWSMLGTAPLSKIKSGLSNGRATASALTDLARRVDSHIKEIDALERDITAAEDLAQGRGVRGIVQSAAGGYVGFVENMLQGPMLIVAAGAVLWLIGPSLLARGRRAMNNPRRGRRR